MSETPDRNDEGFLAIFQAQMPVTLPLTVEEPFAAQAPAEVGAPVRTSRPGASWACRTSRRNGDA